MDYVEAGRLQELADREAHGSEVLLDPPEDEDDTAREELRQLVGRRRDAPPRDLPPLDPVDTTDIAAGVGLQRLSGKLNVTL